jgi:hypothetical protein
VDEDLPRQIADPLNGYGHDDAVTVTDQGVGKERPTTSFGHASRKKDAG